MKKVFKLVLAMLVVLGTVAYGSSHGKVEMPEKVTMENIDSVLGHVAVIDLRNIEDKFSVGYIKNSEFVPFFQILEDKGIVVRGTKAGKKTWDASIAKVDDSFDFEAIFPKEEPLVMFCAGGTRAEFMKEVLVARGYDESLIYNAGAFKNYKGMYRVEATVK